MSFKSPSYNNMIPVVSTKEPKMKSMSSIKSLVESPGFTSLPSTYNFNTNFHEHQIPLIEKFPVIDFSMLASVDPHQRSKFINHDLKKACEDWGIFMVINHGVPEELMSGVMDGCKEFFNMNEEDKQEFQGKDVMDPIRCGTSFNASVEKVFYWRDFLKAFIHPKFHFPNKPSGLSETSFEYCKRIRELARILLEGISESLGLEANYIERSTKFESGFDLSVVNLYPICPEPEFVMGLPPHSDPDLLTFLIHNGIDGLQLERHGKWVNVNSIPNSILVNVGDQLEILSNGKYKSNIHRAVVNNKATRISLAIEVGPSLDTFVSPAPELVNSQSNPPAYIGMNYKDYIQLQQSTKLERKSCLDQLCI